MVTVDRNKKSLIKFDSRVTQALPHLFALLTFKAFPSPGFLMPRPQGAVQATRACLELGNTPTF